MDLQIKTPRWAVPLLEPARYKGTKGGRGSGKSHFFAEALVEQLVMMPDTQAVCIREIQKSLKFSAKKLIETKIRDLCVTHLFDIQLTEIRRKGAEGLIIFQGLQDHTADSIKSLEGFDIAWVEEAQSLSQRSLQLLLPTIRKDGSELWFSWNPDQPTDAVEQLFTGLEGRDDAICIHVNFDQNPWCPNVLKQQAEHDRRTDYDRFQHVWLGGFNSKSEAQVFAGKWRVDDFTPQSGWDGPYHGLDFGFANDPTAFVRCWVHENRLYIDRELSQVGLELDDTANAVLKACPGAKRHVIRADNARPESISYLRRHGLPRIEAVEKGKGSVEDGIEFMKTFDEIVVSPDCVASQDEFQRYSYKIDKRSGDVLPKLEDAHNHIIDSIRYALRPLIRPRQRGRMRQLRGIA